MIEIRLFGTLRRFAENPVVTAESIVRVTTKPNDTVADVLQRLGIDPEHEAGNIFVNGRYHYMAREIPVQDIERLGVFPKNMAMLYV